MGRIDVVENIVNVFFADNIRVVSILNRRLTGNRSIRAKRNGDIAGLRTSVPGPHRIQRYTAFNLILRSRRIYRNIVAFSLDNIIRVTRGRPSKERIVISPESVITWKVDDVACFSGDTVRLCSASAIQVKANRNFLLPNIIESRVFGDGDMVTRLIFGDGGVAISGPAGKSIVAVASRLARWEVTAVFLVDRYGIRCIPSIIGVEGDCPSSAIGNLEVIVVRVFIFVRPTTSFVLIAHNVSGTGLGIFIRYKSCLDFAPPFTVRRVFDFCAVDRCRTLVVCSFPTVFVRVISLFYRPSTFIVAISNAMGLSGKNEIRIVCRSARASLGAHQGDLGRCSTLHFTCDTVCS